jgi:hypothetical protein
VSQRTIAILFAAVVLPLFAHGQQQQTLRDRDPDLEAAKKLANDRQQANFHYGPFYLLSRLRLADAGYSQDSGVPAGDQGGLSLSVEAPQRLFFVANKKAIFTFEVVPGYTFFSGDRDNQLNYSARADAHLLFNHLYLDIYALRADQIRAHVADLNRLATTAENEVGISGEVKYSSRTSGVFTLRRRDTEYPLDRYQPEINPNSDFNAIQLLNREENHARASIAHKTLPMTSLFVSGEVSDYTFGVARYRDSRRTWYGGGALFDNGPNQLRIEAGPVRLEFDDPTQPDYSGVAGSIEGSRVRGRWTYRAGAERDLGFSIFAGNNFYVATSANAGLEYAATSKLMLRTNVAAERDEYDTPVNGKIRTDDITFTSVGALYTLRRLRFGGDVGWYDRESTYGGDTDSGIRYVLHLSFTP